MSRLLKNITIRNVRELSLDPATAIFHLEVRSYLMQVDGLNILVDTWARCP